MSKAAAVLLLGLTLGALGCAAPAGPSATPSAPAPTSPGSLDPRFVNAGAVPDGQLVELAGAKDGSIFVWVQDRTGASFLVEIDRQGREVKRSAVAAGSIFPQNGANHGFAVTDQAIWIGAGRTLFQLSRTSGDVRAWPLPLLPRLGSTGAGTSVASQVDMEINALVPSGRRGLVIGVSGASVIVTLQPDTGVFGQLSLPAVGGANSVGVLADGTIGVGMLNENSHRPDTVAIFSPSDQLTVATAESILISAWGDGFLTSGVGVTHVRTDGTSTPVDLGVSQANERLRPAELADGRVVLRSNNRGLLILDPATRTVTGRIDGFGTVTCGLGEGSHLGHDGPVTSRPPPFPCPASPSHLAASGSDLLVDLGTNGFKRAVAGSF